MLPKRITKDLLESYSKEQLEDLNNEELYYAPDGSMTHPLLDSRSINIDEALKAVPERIKRDMKDLDEDGYVRDDIEF